MKNSVIIIRIDAQLKLTQFLIYYGVYVGYLSTIFETPYMMRMLPHRQTTLMSYLYLSTFSRYPKTTPMNPIMVIIPKFLVIVRP